MEVEKNDTNGHLVAFNSQRIPIPKFLYDCKVYALYISYPDVLARNLSHCVIFINILSSQQPFTNSGFKEQSCLFLVYTICYLWNTDFPPSKLLQTQILGSNHIIIGFIEFGNYIDIIIQLAHPSKNLYCSNSGK